MSNNKYNTQIWVTIYRCDSWHILLPFFSSSTSVKALNDRLSQWFPCYSVSWFDESFVTGQKMLHIYFAASSVCCNPKLCQHHSTLCYFNVLSDLRGLNCVWKWRRICESSRKMWNRPRKSVSRGKRVLETRDCVIRPASNRVQYDGNLIE